MKLFARLALQTMESLLSMYSAICISLSHERWVQTPGHDFRLSHLSIEESRLLLPSLELGGMESLLQLVFGLVAMNCTLSLAFELCL